VREPGTIEKGVLCGRDGHLFLLDGGHHVFDFVLGLRRVRPESLSNFAANIRRRAGICDAAGCRYLHVIFPDKQSVMTEQFPVEDPERLGETYLRALPEIADRVCYPLDALRAIDSPFLKTDTHLTEAGTIAAAGEIVRSLTGDDQSRHIERLLTSEWLPAERTGDLGGRFDENSRESRPIIKRTWLAALFNNKLLGGNNGIVDIIFCKEPVYDSRLLIFGDSFGKDASSILSYFFREVVFLRTAFFHDDMFHQIKPDFVITENVERYLSACVADDARPSFFMYPYMGNAEYAPDTAFAEAFSAILSYGRPPYFDFLKKHQLDNR
jgi:hypothetical protein